MRRPSSETALCAAALVIGLLLRIWQYLHAGSLWLDEAWVALNVVERSVWTLLTQPLMGEQGAPPGFLVLVKTLAETVGRTDGALRLVPLASSLAVLALSWPVARSCFSSAAARVCFVGLVCLSPVLVYYASELKQYSTDSAVCLLLLWAALGVGRRTWLALALTGSLAVWFSHPSAFVLAAIGATLLAQSLGNGRLSEARRVEVYGSHAARAASFAVLNWIQLRQLAANHFLIDYWASAFAPFPISGAADLRWYLDTALGVTYLAFSQQEVAGLELPPAQHGALNVSALALCGLGLAGLFFVNRRLLTVVLLTLGFTTVASANQLYPLRGRLLLFLVPVVCLTIAGLVDWIAARRHAVAAALALVLPLPAAVQLAATPTIHCAMEQAVEHVRQRRLPSDVQLSDWGSHPGFSFYARRHGMEGMQGPDAIPIHSVGPESLIDSWCRDTGLGRAWILLVDWNQPSKRLRARIVARLTVLDSMTFPYGTLQLVDFANDAGCGRAAISP